MIPLNTPGKRPVSLARRTFLPVLGGIGAILAIFGLLWLAALWASRHTEDVSTKLGDTVFHIPLGGTANRIAADGLPVQYADPLSSGRDIYVNHVGPDLTVGWYVFNVLPTGEAHKCAVSWDRAAMVFKDPCTNTTYGPNGFPPAGVGSLVHYTVTVNGNDLAIDLQAPITPTSAPTPTT
jgi:hypothetical protein